MPLYCRIKGKYGMSKIQGLMRGLSTDGQHDINLNSQTSHTWKTIQLWYTASKVSGMQKESNYDSCCEKITLFGVENRGLVSILSSRCFLVAQ